MKTKTLHKKLLAGLAAGTCILVTNGCHTVPITGRQQFIMTSQDTENAAGLKAFNEYKAQLRRSGNAAYNSALTRCGTALAKASGQTGFAWEFIVFDSQTQNAFCLPGGKIAVYSGLMDLMNNEAELAFVVAHEVAHAVARHSGERSSWNQIVSLGGAALGAATGTSGGGELYNTAAKVGVILPFSRSNEYEADQIGMLLMAKAGYNPSAAIEFWSRFAEGSNDSVINGWMSTHPRDTDRINAMRQILPQAQQEYAKASTKRGYGASL